MLSLFSLATVATAIPSWSLDEYDFDTIILSVAFPSIQNGLVPFDDNGVGPGAKVTTDGGTSWNTVAVTQYTSLLMDCAAKGKNAIMGGVADNQYSSDSGNTWTVTSGPKIISQSAEALRDPADDQFFGWTGSTLRGENGVGITKDAGATATFFNISVAETLTRYGAFPSKSVWYISAGEWPQTVEQDPTVAHELTHRLRLHKDEYNRTRTSYLGKTPLRSTEDGWKAQILKTTDGGATFSSVFYNEGEFYFNGIDCADETHCCAVGESDTGTRPGARIWCTTDGTTWNEVYYQAGVDESMLGIRALSDDEWWAAGGRLNTFDFAGAFPHSLDGGATWVNSTVMKVYGTALSFPDTAHGWASVLDRDEQSGLAKYA
jgi:photosystem II stability/assembly factor-like uncharacterized protein